MNRIITAIFLTLAVLAVAPAAQANYFPGFDINTLESYLNGQNGNAAASYVTYTGTLSGAYDITALAFEAAHVNSYMDADGTVLFTNGDTSNFGSYVTVANLSTTYYGDTTNTQYITLDSPGVRVYQLTADWSVPELGITLTSGTLLIGLNDNFSSDGDFDDLILAAHANPTPIPGAFWLLGAGLLGVMGTRRILHRH